MGNLIFFSKEGEDRPTLEHWCHTSEQAWEWINKTVKNLMDNIVLEDWPIAITLVAVISVKDNEDVEVPFALRLHKEKLVVPEYILNLRATVLNPDDVVQLKKVESEYWGYEHERISDERLAGIIKYVRTNWPDYRDLKGLL